MGRLCHLLVIDVLLLQLLGPGCKAQQTGPKVCIVGGGLSGLVVANKMKASGVRVALYEKSFDHIGGKLDTEESWELVWEKGPAIYASGPIVDAYISRLPLTRLKVGGQCVGFYDPASAQVQDVSDEEIRKNTQTWLPLIQRYDKIRGNYPPGLFQPGGFNALHTLRDRFPDLFLSAKDWILHHRLQDLGYLFSIIFTYRGYGLLSDIPAPYMLRHATGIRLFNTLNLVTGYGNNDVYTLKEGFRELAYLLVRDVRNVFMGYELFDISRSDFAKGGTIPLQFHVGRGSRTETVRDCSRVVLAFPPLLEKLIRVDPGMGILQERILNRVKVNKYFSSGHILNCPKGEKFMYFGLLEESASVTSGAPISLIQGLNGNKTGAYTIYSWLYGDYASGPTLEDVGYVDYLQREFLRKFNKEPPELSFIKGFEFFPHVSVGDMAAGWFHNFTQNLQGKDGIYFASPLTAFENVDGAIGNADYVANLVLAGLNNK